MNNKSTLQAEYEHMATRTSINTLTANEERKFAMGYWAGATKAIKLMDQAADLTKAEYEARVCELLDEIRDRATEVYR